MSDERLKAPDCECVYSVYESEDGETISHLYIQCDACALLNELKYGEVTDENP